MSSLQPAQQHDASDDEERVERQLLPESAHALLQRSLWALFVLHHPKYTPKLRVLSNSYYYPLGGGDEDCVCVRERETERERERWMGHLKKTLAVSLLTEPHSRVQQNKQPRFLTCNRIATVFFLR